MLKKMIHKIKNNFPHVTIRSRRAVEYDLIKTQLVDVDNGIVLWEIDFEGKKAVNPGNKVLWSDEFRKMLGFDDENDFPNLLASWSARLHPEDKERTLTILKHHLDDIKGTKPYDVEYRLMLKNGEYKHFHARGAAMRNHEGAPLKMIGSLMDISDKRNLGLIAKKHKAELEQKQKILDALYNVGDALSTANRQTFERILSKSMGVLGEAIKADRIQVWRNESVGGNLHFTLSDQWLSELGDKLEISPKCHTYPYDAVPGWEDKLRRVKHINSPIVDLLPHEYTFFNRQGVKTLMIVPLFKNRSLWGFLRADDCTNERVFTDEEITDVNTAGQFLALALITRESLDAAKNETEKNTEMQHWYMSILDAIPIPISVTDNDMKLTLTNTAIENMVGKKRASLNGKRCSALDTDICNTTNCGIACAKRYVNRTYFKSSGKTYQVDVSRLNDLNGEPSGFVEVIQDVTEPGMQRDLSFEENMSRSGFLH